MIDTKKLQLDRLIALTREQDYEIHAHRPAILTGATGDKRWATFDNPIEVFTVVVNHAFKVQPCGPDS